MICRQIRGCLSLVVTIGLIPAVAGAQGRHADYLLAEQFLSPSVDELVLNDSLRPE